MYKVTSAIELARQGNKYYPGETVVGSLVCEFGEDISILGIQVLLSGNERIFWKHKDTKIGVVPIQKHNSIFMAESILAKAGFYLAGVHTYPFTFQLPQHLPASFAGKFGYVEYTVRAGINLLLQGFVEQTRHIVILPLIDIHPSAIVQRHVHYSVEMYVNDMSDGCCGMITMNAQLEKDVFVLGELIKITGRIWNQSVAVILNVEACIKIIIYYTSTAPIVDTQVEAQEVARFRTAESPMKKNNFYTIHMAVPKTYVMPNFFPSTMMRHSVYLDVIPILENHQTRSRISIPIILLSVPVRRSPLDVPPIGPEPLPHELPLALQPHVPLPPAGNVPYADAVVSSKMTISNEAREEEFSLIF